MSKAKRTLEEHKFELDQLTSGVSRQIDGIIQDLTF